MVIIMRSGASESHISTVRKEVEARGFEVVENRGKENVVVAIIGIIDTNQRQPLIDHFSQMDGVERVTPITKPYKLTAKAAKIQTKIHVGDVEIGNGRFVVIAGPCALESPEQLMSAAAGVKAAGAAMLRVGIYKPRTGPYAFQGMEEEGIEIVHGLKGEIGLPIVSEITRPQMVEKMSEVVDILQIGARNAQNSDLLKEVGRGVRPVVLKRGLSMTLDELMQSAEYILSEGNPNVILCERGIRTFETATRNTLDLGGAAYLKTVMTHLPVIIDPSHGTGIRELIAISTKMAVAGGFDGLLVEVHPKPWEALCDGPQSLTIEKFGKLMSELKRIAPVFDKAI
ncbi:MAG TPA: 3-deoxy-7-phosphoheptulonate synthase [Patescibacteria group bacterium]|nr:3-deoxy-7-phosphoheptulonate synthase [Patescibacteria group bacterium]